MCDFRHIVKQGYKPLRSTFSMHLHEIFHPGWTPRNIHISRTSSFGSSWSPSMNFSFSSTSKSRAGIDRQQRTIQKWIPDASLHCTRILHSVASMPAPRLPASRLLCSTTHVHTPLRPCFVPRAPRCSRDPSRPPTFSAFRVPDPCWSGLRVERLCRHDLPS